MPWLVPPVSGLLAMALACLHVALAFAGEATQYRWQLDVPQACQAPRGEWVEVEPMPRVSRTAVLTVEPHAWSSGGDRGRAANGLIAQRGAMLAADVDDGVGAVIPATTIPRWSDQLAAVAPGADARDEPFNLAAFARRMQSRFLDQGPPDREPRALGFEKLVADETPRSYEAPHWRDSLGAAWKAQSTLTSEPVEPWLTFSMRRRPLAPAGTMYLWSFESSASAATEPHGAGERWAPSTSAGFVLTRPPGAYSEDWVGVAVTAPLH